MRKASTLNAKFGLRWSRVTGMTATTPLDTTMDKAPV
jgi:hypothetical protein